MSTFWKTAMGDRHYRPDLIQDEQPEQLPDFGEMSATEYAQNRASYVQANSDFLGAEGWSREKRAWQPPREERAADKYAAERQAAGIGEAPDSSALPHLRERQRQVAAWISEYDPHNSPRSI